MELLQYVQENKPKSLFHYRRCTEYTIEAFRENKIYFNTAKLLKEEGSIEEICKQLKKHEKIETWKKRIYNPLRSIKNLLKRL